MPQQERSRATRRALLAAAGERFAVQGFHGTALSELFGDGGVPTKGAFYFHFASKHAVAEALVAAMSESWEQVLPAVRRVAGDALEALVLLTDAVIVRLDDPIVRGAGRVLRDRVVASPTLAEVGTWWRDEAEGLLVEAQAAGLLRAEVDPGWAASEVVAGFAGRATMSEEWCGGPPLWELVNDFWAGFLPLIATPDWSRRWEGRPWRQRRRPVGVGPQDIAGLEIPAISPSGHDGCGRTPGPRSAGPPAGSSPRRPARGGPPTSP
ncbi:TetR/AcrR family transcriptional regulator [Actinomycetospora straminea]|uniref:TetR/AcrR family transcriptional regulator n=1 Tax=Actinomycetospora straminea TaxID=663607 RepID=UPI00236519DE|nr:TetR/AcrR family transcriptional regulator [Actinomycetospora straminea]MDD7933869.1 TetR/AcrR family transcriptional regulator [Actinomycetospora straminea]